MVWTATRLEQLVHSHPTSCRDQCCAALLHYRNHSKSTLCIWEQKPYSMVFVSTYNTGADPGFFLRRGCTRLLLYFNTNKPHSFFFFCGIPVVLENRRSSQGGATPCTLLLDPPPPLHFIKNFFLLEGLQGRMVVFTDYGFTIWTVPIIFLKIQQFLRFRFLVTISFQNGEQRLVMK